MCQSGNGGSKNNAEVHDIPAETANVHLLRLISNIIF